MLQSGIYLSRHEVCVNVGMHILRHARSAVLGQNDCDLSVPLRRGFSRFESGQGIVGTIAPRSNAMHGNDKDVSALFDWRCWQRLSKDVPLQRCGEAPFDWSFSGCCWLQVRGYVEMSFVSDPAGRVSVTVTTSRTGLARTSARESMV